MNNVPLPDDTTPQGNYESGIVYHETCEIAHGLASNTFRISRLDEWGTTITLTISRYDQKCIDGNIR
jgi:hypothetical protein